MNPSVQSVEVHDDYQLLLQFSNNEYKWFNVKPYLKKGVFAQLEDTDYFNRVSVRHGSVVWPDGQDFSHDTLYLLSETKI